MRRQTEGVRRHAQMFTHSHTIQQHFDPPFLPTIDSHVPGEKMNRTPGGCGALAATWGSCCCCCCCRCCRGRRMVMMMVVRLRAAPTRAASKASYDRHAAWLAGGSVHLCVLVEGCHVDECGVQVSDMTPCAVGSANAARTRVIHSLFIAPSTTSTTVTRHTHGRSNNHSEYSRVIASLPTGVLFFQGIHSNSANHPLRANLRLAHDTHAYICPHQFAMDTTHQGSHLHVSYPNTNIYVQQS